MPGKRVNKLAIAIVVSTMSLGMSIHAGTITSPVFAFAEPSNWTLMLVTGGLAVVYYIARHRIRM